MGSRQAVLLAAFGALLGATALATGVVPVGLSPGSERGINTVDRCPYFAWTAVPAAVSYELVVYEVWEERVEERPVLREWIRGSAHSWRPSSKQCLQREGRYAWSVRARGRNAVSGWSEPLLFEVDAKGPNGGLDPEGASPPGQTGHVGEAPLIGPVGKDLGSMTRPGGSGTPEDAFRVALSIGKKPLTVLAQMTGSPSAEKLVSHLAQDRFLLANLTSALTATFGDGQLAELAAFFESPLGQAWVANAPDLPTLLRATSKGITAELSLGLPEKNGAARRLAEEVSVDFFIEDTRLREKFLANLAGILASTFTGNDIEALTVFFESSVGREWQKHQSGVLASFLIDVAAAGCALAVLAPNLDTLLAKRAPFSEEDLDRVLGALRPQFNTVQESCACVWEKAVATWGAESVVSADNLAQMPSLMLDSWGSGECPEPLPLGWTTLDTGDSSVNVEQEGEIAADTRPLQDEAVRQNSGSTKIKVTLDGLIYLDGTEITLAELRSELGRLGKGNGTVLYYREGGETPPVGAERTSAQVLFLITSSGLSVRWSEEASE